MFRPSVMLTALLAIAELGNRVNAYMETSPQVECQRQVIKGVSRRICATTTLFSPSLDFANGTFVGYIGPTGYDFEFWKGLREGADTSTGELAEKHMYNKAGVSWEDGLCTVNIAGAQCDSCSICNEADEQALTTLSANCTNIARGRKVTCEKAFIFFPLKRNKRKKLTGGGLRN